MRLVLSGYADSPHSILMPNAAAQPLPEAGAQRTLEAVGCSGLLGEFFPATRLPVPRAR